MKISTCYLTTYLLNNLALLTQDLTSKVYMFLFNVNLSIYVLMRILVVFRQKTQDEGPQDPKTDHTCCNSAQEEEVGSQEAALTKATR